MMNQTAFAEILDQLEAEMKALEELRKTNASTFVRRGQERAREIESRFRAWADRAHRVVVR